MNNVATSSCRYTTIYLLLLQAPVNSFTRLAGGGHCSSRVYASASRASTTTIMTTVLPPLSPLHFGLNHEQLLAEMSNKQIMSGRKRKASEELSDNERMSTSPSASPSITGRSLLQPQTPHRIIKRTKTGAASGRALALPRLLETLSADEMRNLLQNICDQRPELQQEIVTMAPRPSVESTLSVLHKYEDAFREAFPFGNRPSSEYAYNRVRTHLVQLLDAMREFTPHFLPPNETHDGISLTYLDATTDMIHRLPDWDSYQHQRHKNEAYDEISKAWALVIREASKRAGGFHLHFGGWDQKLIAHNYKSGSRMEEAVAELKVATGYANPSAPSSSVPTISDERASIRQQLFSGTYGQQLGVGPPGW